MRNCTRLITSARRGSVVTEVATHARAAEPASLLSGLAVSQQAWKGPASAGPFSLAPLPKTYAVVRPLRLAQSLAHGSFLGLLPLAPGHRKGPLSRLFLKADARTRTGDPFITSEVLYQLSYVGNRGPPV